ncbi:hypothetical protein MTO96_013060 [Rhipicephalus appendiculatus]
MMDTRHALVEVCEPRGKKDTPFLPPPGLPFHSPRIFRCGAERPKEKDVTWEGWPAKARPRRSQDRLARIRNCERSIISGCRLAESCTGVDAGTPSPKKSPGAPAGIFRCGLVRKQVPFFRSHRAPRQCFRLYLCAAEKARH